MSLLLSAQTGEPITAAQLLGEETNDVATREREAESKLRKLRKKMRKAGIA